VSTNDMIKPVDGTELVQSCASGVSATLNSKFWDDFFASYVTADVPENFMIESDRQQGVHDRDPFDGIDLEAGGDQSKTNQPGS
jgi:hypothetical protein